MSSCGGAPPAARFARGFAIVAGFSSAARERKVSHPGGKAKQISAEHGGNDSAGRAARTRSGIGRPVTLGVMKHALAFPALCSVIAACAGCASDPAETAGGATSYIVVPQSRYAEAFDAACAAAREERLMPEVADRQSGTISTTPRPAGSVAEPWTWHELTASELVEGTLAFERRRAHFEFVPTGFRPAGVDAAAPLPGPSLPGAPRGESTTLSTNGGELELRVSVAVERQFRPGQQGSPYTRSMRDRKSTRLNSSHSLPSRMPSSA